MTHLCKQWQYLHCEEQAYTKEKRKEDVRCSASNDVSESQQCCQTCPVSDFAHIQDRCVWEAAEAWQKPTESCSITGRWKIWKCGITHKDNCPFSWIMWWEPCVMRCMTSCLFRVILNHENFPLSSLLIFPSSICFFWIVSKLFPDGGLKYKNVHSNLSVRVPMFHVADAQ